MPFRQEASWGWAATHSRTWEPKGTALIVILRNSSLMEVVELVVVLPSVKELVWVAGT